MATALTLSAAELARLEALQYALLSPLDAPSVDAWRSTVNGRVRDLFQANTAAFALPPAAGRTMCYSEELSPEARTMFEAVYFGDAARERALTRKLEVWNQTLIIAGDWSTYHRDPVVNEFLKPNGLLDAAGFLVDWGGENPSAPEFASLYAYHDRYGTERLGDKAVLMLRLVLPAFKAGVRTVLRLGEQRRALAGVLDTIDYAVQVRSANGRVLHETPALGRLVASAQSLPSCGRSWGAWRRRLSRT